GAQAPATGDDHGGVFQLRPLPLLDVVLDDAGRRAPDVGEVELLDLGGATARRLDGERLGSNENDVGLFAGHFRGRDLRAAADLVGGDRSEEHTSELQSRENLVCRLLLEKKKKMTASSERV